MHMKDDGRRRERRHERLKGEFPVRVSTIEADQDPWTGKSYFRASQETCADVSRGGAFVRTTELLNPGRRILLELHLPNGSQIEAIGRVAWTRRILTQGSPQPDTGVGVEFLGGATDQLAALDDFLAKGAEESKEEEGN
jgi:Tfp pilus assembly protein PilZ